MLVYFCCRSRPPRKSFEWDFSRELIRNGMSLWSESVFIETQSSILTDDYDDNMGNTGAAIIVLSKKFLDETDNIDRVKKILQYRTIKVFWVLNGIGQTYAESRLKDELPDINVLLSGRQTFNSASGKASIATSIGFVLSKEKETDKNRIPTGIPVLDYLLNGGFMKASSLNIIGPTGSGKTTLGVQIQKSVLESGIGCLYITYSESPMKIIQRFVDIGCDIEKHISDGKFRIYDSYSSLHGLSEDDVRLAVGDKFYPAIVRVEDPYDVETYFGRQIEVIKEIGPGGVNIIDSVNVRYEITEKQKQKNAQTYKEYFSRFKAVAGDSLKNVGIHVVQADETEDTLVRHLTRVEDGSIRLKAVEEKNGDVRKFLRIENEGQLGNGNTKWHEYVVNKDGISFMPFDYDEEDIYYEDE